MSDNKLEMKYIDIELIEPNSWNPQDMDTATMNLLVKEISEVGFTSPIQVVALDDGRFRIIGGEHRWLAAKTAGLTEIPCGILPGARWADLDLQKLATVRMNAIGGKLDPEKFAHLYSEMADKYGTEPLQELFGFTDAQAFAKLLGGIQKNLKKAMPKAMHGAIDDAMKEAKTVADLSNIIQTLFAQYGDTVSQSFMIFSYGKSNHVYIQMSKEVKKYLDKITAHCRTTGEDINDVIGVIMKATVDSLPKDAPKEPSKDDSDIDF